MPKRQIRPILLGQRLQENERCSCFKKSLDIPSKAEALPGRPNPIRTASQHFVNGNPLKGPYPAGLETAIFGIGCFWGAERKFWELGDGIYIDRGRLCRRPDAEPDLRGGVLRPHRPQRGGAGGVRPEEDLLREAAEDLLGEPRPDPGHAPGQRRRHPVPLRHLHDLAGAEEGRRGVQGDVRQGAGGQALRRDHDRDSSTRRRSTSPRTITSSIWRRTRWAIAGSAAPACRARSEPASPPRRTDRAEHE